MPLLADYFVRKHAPRCGRKIRGVAPDALARLAKHHWPGNVRELENIIEQAPASLDYHEAVEDARRQLIVRAFEQAGHSHATAARLLGVHPNYLHRLIKNLNLKSRVAAPDS